MMKNDEQNDEQDSAPEIEVLELYAWEDATGSHPDHQPIARLAIPRGSGIPQTGDVVVLSGWEPTQDPPCYRVYARRVVWGPPGSVPRCSGGCAAPSTPLAVDAGKGAEHPRELTKIEVYVRPMTADAMNALLERRDGTTP